METVTKRNRETFPDDSQVDPKKRRSRADGSLNAGFVDVYGSEARVEVELKTRKHPLKLSDVTNLVLWCLGDGMNPNWVFIKNKPLVSGVVLLHVPGLTVDILHHHKDDLREMLEVCGEEVRVNTLNATVHPSTTVGALLTVQVTAKPKDTMNGTPATSASAQAKKDSGSSDGTVKSSPPFPASYYVLTPGEMLSNNYPLPQVDEDGGLVCPEGFVATQPPKVKSEPDSEATIVAVDCEMCYTSLGLELTRATFLTKSGAPLYDQLVVPPRPITDHNTRHSGITAQMMEGVTTTIEDVQSWVLKNISSETLIVGHAVENDLKAMKIIHSKVIDTAVLFPHPKGPPYKPALRVLAERYLGRTIQASSDGHDSHEDAKAALDLTLLKIQRGPAFGAPNITGESVCELLSRQGRKCLLIDRRNTLHRFVSGSAGAVPVDADEEAVKACTSACRRWSSQKNNNSDSGGSLDFVWAHLTALQVSLQRAAMTPAGEGKSGSDHHPSPSSTSRSGEVGCSGSSSSSNSDLKQVLHTISTQVRRVFDSLGRNNVLVVTTGQGDTAAVRRMQEDKWKRIQGVDGRPPWDEASEALLSETNFKARQALCFVTTNHKAD